MTVVYACKSDKVASAETKTSKESTVTKVDETPNNNKTITATNTDDKSSSSPMLGEKRNMKGSLPAKTFRVKGGVVNSVQSGMVILNQTKKLVRAYIDLGEGR